MSVPKTAWLLPSIAYLALGIAPALADEASWRQAHDAGWKAYQEGRFDEADKLMRAAEKEARTFGDKDPRLYGRSLRSLEDADSRRDGDFGFMGSLAVPPHLRSLI
jgi:hypothetical protein